MEGEPLDEGQVKRLARACLDNGKVVFSRHAQQEMAKDSITVVDCRNVLRAGIVEPAEFENGSWRYRIRTNRFYVVVAFRSRSELVVVTAWRIAR